MPLVVLLMFQRVPHQACLPSRRCYAGASTGSAVVGGTLAPATPVGLPTPLRFRRAGAANIAAVGRYTTHSHVRQYRLARPVSCGIRCCFAEHTLRGAVQPCSDGEVASIRGRPTSVPRNQRRDLGGCHLWPSGVSESAPHACLPSRRCYAGSSILRAVPAPHRVRHP